MTIEELQAKLLNANVNEHTEKKNGLTYLSWAWAWAEALKADPTANYEIITFDGVPYKETNMGIMCYTKVTMCGVTRSMWLPVMDAQNNAMRSEAYELVQWGKRKSIAAATMFDVNKTIMRCLVKNLAMFGLGMYIYAGEDLPEEIKEQDDAKPEKKAEKTIGEGQGFTLKQASATVTDVNPLADEVKGLADLLPEADSINFYAFVGKTYGGKDLNRLDEKVLITLKRQLERKLNMKGGE